MFMVRLIYYELSLRDCSACTSPGRSFSPTGKHDFHHIERFGSRYTLEVAIAFDDMVVMLIVVAISFSILILVELEGVMVSYYSFYVRSTCILHFVMHCYCFLLSISSSTFFECRKKFIPPPPFWIDGFQPGLK
jgi:hypothetical protein